MALYIRPTIVYRCSNWLLKLGDFFKKNHTSRHPKQVDVSSVEASTSASANRKLFNPIRTFFEIIDFIFFILRHASLRWNVAIPKILTKTITRKVGFAAYQSHYWFLHKKILHSIKVYSRFYRILVEKLLLCTSNRQGSQYNWLNLSKYIYYN